MPNVTPTYAFRSPLATGEGADGPVSIQNLAQDVEAALLAAAPAVGDFKDSAQTTSHGRWLLCDVEREMSRTEIEAELGLAANAAQALITLLGTGTASIYGSAAASKAKIPGFRGQVGLAQAPIHPKTGTGSAGGEENHLLTAEESGLPAHAHPLSNVTHVESITPTMSTDNSSVDGARSRVSAVPYTLAVTSVSNNNAATAGSFHNNMPPFRVKGYCFIRV